VNHLTSIYTLQNIRSNITLPQVRRRGYASPLEHEVPQGTVHSIAPSTRAIRTAQSTEIKTPARPSSRSSTSCGSAETGREKRPIRSTAELAGHQNRQKGRSRNADPVRRRGSHGGPASSRASSARPSHRRRPSQQATARRPSLAARSHCVAMVSTASGRGRIVSRRRRPSRALSLGWAGVGGAVGFAAELGGVSGGGGGRGLEPGGRWRGR
jgi:hypothetical protein